MHISDHIHEWRQHHFLINFEIPDQPLTEWFTKSFVNEITKDIAMGADVTEEKSVARSQYLHLVYSNLAHYLMLCAWTPSLKPEKLRIHYLSTTSLVLFPRLLESLPLLLRRNLPPH